MTISEVQWQPPGGAAALPALRVQAAGAQMVVLPGRGAKIVSLFHEASGKEWLWLNAHLPWRAPDPAESFVALHDVGGWDECFPTVAPTTVAGRRWPDHGDLWWRPWAAERRGAALWMGVEGEGYRFERAIEPRGEGFYFTYRVTNLGASELPYLWCAHPLLTSDSLLTIELLGRPRLFVGADGPLGKRGQSALWPTIEGRSLEQVGKPSGLAAKLFVEMKRGEVTLCDRAGASLRLRWPLADLPMLGLWINEGGWSGADTPPYCNLGVEPASGAPDDLALALDEWQCARTLAPGESHGWWLSLALACPDP